MVNLVAIKNLAMSRKILLEKWNKVSKIKFKILLSFSQNDYSLVDTLRGKRCLLI